MPLTYTREFRVRHYECDAFGHLNNANYLRYMQETAFDASAAAGYDQDRYSELGHSWVIRETDIEYLKPIRYGDIVSVKTWVIDFQRVRSRRAYEFYLHGSGDLVAKAITDWVFVENRSSKPATIPDEIRRSYISVESTDSIPPREKFPITPTPPPGIFEMDLRVAWRDVDAVQHVNNAVYLNYVDECGMQVLTAHGWPITRMVAEEFAILIRRHQIQYRHPARHNDELILTTWASNLRRSTVIRYYKIIRKGDNRQIAFVHSLGVFVDLKTGRPARFPEVFLADFAPNLVL